MRKLLLLVSVACLLSCVREAPGEGFSVVAVDFPSYDAARAVMGDDGLSMLLPPGSGSHGYEPTPKDMVSIATADAVIYTGGPSDSWMDAILSSLSDPPPVFRLADQVELLSEEHKEGMEDDGDSGHEAEGQWHEIDEHVWTSPLNEAVITVSLAEFLSALNPDGRKVYESGRDERLEALRRLDSEIREVVEGSPGRTLLFASRFPLLYFTREYGLEYYAAFPGCAEESEPSARTIAFLIDKAEEQKVPAVLYIELSSPSIARVIAEEAGCKAMEFHSLHNVTQAAFRSGADYISLMEGNIEVLREVLR